VAAPWDRTAENEISHDITTLTPILNSIRRSRYLGIALRHPALDLHGTTQRIHGTDKQDQQAVAGCSYDAPPAVLGKLGRNELGMMRVELGEGAFIVHADQAAVAGYIRDQDGRKLAFDLLASHG
jgi:hypothetical protein